MKPRIHIHPSMTVNQARQMAESIGASIISDYRGGAVIVPGDQMEQVKADALRNAPCFADDLIDLADPEPVSITRHGNSTVRRIPRYRRQRVRGKQPEPPEAA